MEIVLENNKHTVIDNNFGVFFWVKYSIFEYSEILGEKEEVNHPSGKRKILEHYNIQF